MKTSTFILAPFFLATSILVVAAHRSIDIRNETVDLDVTIDTETGEVSIKKDVTITTYTLTHTVQTSEHVYAGVPESDAKSESDEEEEDKEDETCEDEEEDDDEECEEDGESHEEHEEEGEDHEHHEQVEEEDNEGQCEDEEEEDKEDETCEDEEDGEETCEDEEEEDKPEEVMVDDEEVDKLVAKAFGSQTLLGDDEPRGSELPKKIRESLLSIPEIKALPPKVLADLMGLPESVFGKLAVDVPARSEL
ncbi:hypothetical protein H072_1810 [Dactylellina haptotyla CBS 200.50]|uniref:Uncharacterized protein n=1 Tax=Dactylellina haptotyla (strain CBS 200.50) TaxID=1284197 RepID=S8BXF2_DACHA|nr:hypothetical protein H072_1810 [Dactylellina haptotyla CBS 200.50]